MKQLLTPHSLLSEAQDSYGFTPAVTVDGDPLDFEMFAESVEYLCADLRACGVDSGCRIGLGVQSGWIFVLTWHALVSIDAVVIPVDLCDEDSVGIARDLDLDYLLTHRTHDDVLEDVIDELVHDESSIPVFRVADEFALVEVGCGSSVRSGGGGLVSDLRTGIVEKTALLLIEAERIGRRLDLWPGVSVRLGGPLNTRPTMLLIIACATRGACACLESEAGPVAVEGVEMVPVIDRPGRPCEAPLLSVC
ncbi:hypothetical protein G3I13_03060 [Streptomyces sp. SID6673]|nr:hypothetical protein [Streptomyces sp. SID11726]NEB23303.1 hypothetical protein [Streptomyces sp. SID6673]